MEIPQLLNGSSFLIGLFRALPICLLLPPKPSQIPFHSRLLLSSLMAGLAASMIELPAAISLVLIFEQLLIGLAIVTPIALTLGAIEMWTDVLEAARGITIVTTYDPTNERSSSLSRVLHEYSWVLLLWTGAIEYLVLSYLESFKCITHSGNIELEVFARSYGEFIVHALPIGLKACLPTAMLFLLVEVSVGLFGKIVPNLKVSTEALLLKGLIFCCALFVAGMQGPTYSIFKALQEQSQYLHTMLYG